MRINSKACISLLILLVSATVAGGAIQLVEQLRIDYRVLVSAERDYRLRREHGGLGGVEASDYAAYLAKLMRRVAEDCVALARTGSRVPRDIDCPAPSGAAVSSAQIDQHTEQTGGEKIAALDAELNAGLGEFDEMLLREQERVKAAAPRSESGAEGNDGDLNGEGGEANGLGNEDGTDNGEGGQSNGREGGDTNNDGQTGGSHGGRKSTGSEGGMGPGNKTTKGGQPADIPDGSDDDLVARQLREAAEKETDPELKAKLWEEYRKYKQGTR